MADPAISASLRELNLNGVEDVLGRFRLFDDEVRAYAGPGPILSDERPIFEYFFAQRTTPGDLARSVRPVR